MIVENRQDVKSHIDKSGYCHGGREWDTEYSIRGQIDGGPGIFKRNCETDRNRSITGNKMGMKTKPIKIKTLQSLSIAHVKTDTTKMVHT